MPCLEEAVSSQTLSNRGRYVALCRSRDADDPELQAAKRDLGASRLEDHARKVAAEFPPLTDEQVSRIVSLLRGAVSVGAGSPTTGRQVTSPPGGGRVA